MDSMNCKQTDALHECCTGNLQVCAHAQGVQQGVGSFVCGNFLQLMAPVLATTTRANRKACSIGSAPLFRSTRTVSSQGCTVCLVCLSVQVDQVSGVKAGSRITGEAVHSAARPLC
jgi:hypothetical protein